MITVKVQKRSDSPVLQLYYRDPVTGNAVRRSAKTTSWKLAERAAVEWEIQLRNSAYVSNDPSWDAFRTRFEDEHLPAKARRTKHSYVTALNQFERVVGSPKRLSAITSSMISDYGAKLRREKYSDVTVGNILRHLKSALRWANAVGMLREIPRFVMPSLSGQRLMRGRAITDAEFQLLRKAAEELYPPPAHQPWDDLLCGLMLSGLRISEAMRLSWDSPPWRIDLDAKPHPRLVIYSEGQKSRRDQLLPITPDFTHFLRELKSRSTGTGKVFAGLPWVSADNIGREISRIGQHSGVVVNDEAEKFVSAHDLRRSFGQRWSVKVRPAVLRALMRHASIETTMRYYVSDDALSLGDELWGT